MNLYEGGSRMVSRTTLLSLVTLFLTGSLVSAAAAAPANAPAAPEPAALTTGTNYTPARSCGAGKGSAAELSLFVREPARQQSIESDYCGSCGTDPCRGVLRGTYCGWTAGHCA